MVIGKWKRKLFPYNPNKRKILTFPSDVQPHAKTCDCKPCRKYRVYITLVNPDRLDDNGNVNGAELRDKQQNTKGLRKSLEEQLRERRHLASIKWRG